jgi:curved DNA-binding protein CbpA
MDVNAYSLEEILHLFQLDARSLNQSSLLQCKKKIVQLHPDKNPRLPPEYFLFYKAAFDRVVELYRAMHRDESYAPQEKMTYEPDAGAATATVKPTEKDLSQFQKKFNDVFETTFRPDEARKESRQDNSWFYETGPPDPALETPRVQSTNQISSELERLRRKYTAVGAHRAQDSFRELSSCQASIDNNLYGGGRGGTGGRGEGEGEYITSDVFGKLRFEDLKRVHKDETIFAVSESDYSHLASGRAKNLDQIEMQRSDGNTYISEMDYNRNVRTWKQTHQANIHDILSKRDEANRRTNEFERMNESIRAQFRQITAAGGVGADGGGAAFSRHP